MSANLMIQALISNWVVFHLNTQYSIQNPAVSYLMSANLMIRFLHWQIVFFCRPDAGGSDPWCWLWFFGRAKRWTNPISGLL